ncbi:unnamed protein product [Pseudo-nitzschia multistriata]|uniref:Serine aminopeptidase S33 domain-containing protein n=1 Tax=Pseudo-nitzschia multistriata TaxID=183589 RepID=A0A448YYC1_9STRA|nr:unnamed protein product [Pseudo-nitzschia multistriata]
MLLAAKSSTALLSKHAPIGSGRSATNIRRAVIDSLGRRQNSVRALGSGNAIATATKGGIGHHFFSAIDGNHRGFRSSATACRMSIADTPLGKAKEGEQLLDGLDVYTVPSREDGHPLTVYGIGGDESEPTCEDHVLLMLHGRTWSSVPVYHLLGGPLNAEKGLESRSLMEALHDKNIRVYSMDFRGFGGTPADASGGVEPNRCMEDVESVLDWLAKRHGCKTPEKVSLMGWSQGALVAQLAAQRDKPLFSRLILYGSIFDPMVRFPRDPLYLRNPPEVEPLRNTFDAAIEDFTIEGTIPPKAATYFADAALLADPIKAQWKHMYQFNNCDPARVHVPTLVVVGDQDPYAPLHVQSTLFTNLGRGTDRTWSILSDADHAVHLLEGRSRFQSIVTSFIMNSKKIGKETVF